MKNTPTRCKWLAKIWYLLQERDLNFRSLKSQITSLTWLSVAVFVPISALVYTLYPPDTKWDSSWYVRNYGPGCKKTSFLLWIFNAPPPKKKKKTTTKTNKQKNLKPQLTNQLTKKTTKPWEDMLEGESIVTFWYFSYFFKQWIWEWVETGDLDIVTILKVIRLDECSA